MKNNKITLKDKKIYFCIPFKNSGRNVNLNKFIDFSNSPGWLIGNNKVEEWYFAGITNKNDTTYIYGKNFNGICINDFLSYSIDKALKYFKRLVDALILLKQNNISLPSIQLDSIYFLGNDKVLFLPPSVFEKIKSIDNNYNINNYSLINNPYLNKSSEKASYSILTLFYYLLTNKFPFEGNSEDEIYNKIRNLKIIPPKLINPEIKNEVSNHITSLFKNNNYKHLELTHWQKYIEEMINKGVTEKITQDEKQKLKEEYKKLKENTNEKFKKKIFWEKNRNKILLISVIAIISGIFSFYLLKNYFKPRVIKGFPPKKVVETYYQSINKLDHITMQDCVLKNTGKSDINEVLSLYINQKQSIAYTGKSTLIFAEDWIRKGKPEIKPPSYIYGILDLKIKEKTSDIGKKYIAEYEKWEPIIDETKEDDKRVQFQSFKIRDEVNLIKRKKYWLINKIERVKKNKIQK
jgi:hypothetical protein